MIEIVAEKCLAGQTWAHLDAVGELTIIEDVSLPEAEQTYVYLDTQKAQALASFLYRPDVQEAVQ